MHGERRRHPRVPFHVTVDLHSEDNFYAGETRDLSQGGLFIASPADVQVGDTVHVRLHLAGKLYEVSIEVAWILLDRRGDPAGFGARFQHISKATCKAIESFMRRRAPLPFVLLADDPAEPSPESGVPAIIARATSPPSPARDSVFPETLRTGAAPPVSFPPLRALPPPLPWTPSCTPQAR